MHQKQAKQNKTKNSQKQHTMGYNGGLSEKETSLIHRIQVNEHISGKLRIL